MKRLERAVHVAANAGDGAEILVDHRERLGVHDRLRGESRLGVHRFGPVQISPGLVDYRDHIERVGDRGRRAGLSRGGNRRFQNIYRRAAIALLEVCSSQPPQRGKSGVITCERVPYQGFVANRSIAPPALALGEFCRLYEYSYLRRFYLVGARGVAHSHDEARIVRRAEPSSRSFLVSVGREIPRMRAAALRFPPVRPIVV